MARAAQAWQGGDAWPWQFGADPLLGNRRALGQLPALHWIEKLQTEVPPCTGGMKPTGRDQG